MALSGAQLRDLYKEASIRLLEQMKVAYRDGELRELLKKYDMLDLYPSEEEEGLFQSYRDGKILIIGHTKVKRHEILGCFKDVGIDKDRVEMLLEFSEIERYNFLHVRYNPMYRLILCGPLPHSGVHKGDHSSILTNLQHTDGYPKVIRLEDPRGLKISKTNLKSALKREIDAGYLQADWTKQA